MRPTMYIFVNRGLGMSPGKMAAQAAHAAVEAYQISSPGMTDEWYLGGHYCKLVMEADDELHLHTIDRYLKDRGFGTALIIDEGHTEIRAHSVTALGVEISDRDHPHTKATFSDFKLYGRDRPKIPTTTEGWGFRKRDKSRSKIK